MAEPTIKDVTKSIEQRAKSVRLSANEGAWERARSQALALMGDVRELEHVLHDQAPPHD